MHLGFQICCTITVTENVVYRVTCLLTSNIQYHLIRLVARGPSRTTKISLLASHDYYPARHVELQVMPGIKRKMCCARCSAKNEGA